MDSLDVIILIVCCLYILSGLIELTRGDLLAFIHNLIIAVLFYVIMKLIFKKFFDDIRNGFEKLIKKK